VRGSGVDHFRDWTAKQSFNSPYWGGEPQRKSIVGYIDDRQFSSMDKQVAMNAELDLMAQMQRKLDQDIANNGMELLERPQWNKSYDHARMQTRFELSARCVQAGPVRPYRNATEAMKNLQASLHGMNQSMARTMTAEEAAAQMRKWTETMTQKPIEWPKVETKEPAKPKLPDTCSHGMTSPQWCEQCKEGTDAERTGRKRKRLPRHRGSAGGDN
jgi:hypothetical protein